MTKGWKCGAKVPHFCSVLVNIQSHYQTKWWSSTSNCRFRGCDENDCGVDRKTETAFLIWAFWLRMWMISVTWIRFKWWKWQVADSKRVNKHGFFLHSCRSNSFIYQSKFELHKNNLIFMDDDIMDEEVVCALDGHVFCWPCYIVPSGLCHAHIKCLNLVSLCFSQCNDKNKDIWNGINRSLLIKK